MKVVRRSLRRRLKSRLNFLIATGKAILYRHYYDQVLSSGVKITFGAMALGREAGIYLIFPANGLLPSHINVLKTMRAEGISPIVVSNLALSDADRAEIEPLSHAILERPNIGYDFGGYRDAILFLQPMISDLERLWILNDSAWLIEQDISWFQQARAAACDFVGASYSRTHELKTLEDAKKHWPPNSSDRFFHYGSYALLIGSNALRHKDFLRFWKKLLITNDKALTVRRGEMGLSQWIIRNGFSHCATCDFGAVEAEFQALPSAVLDRIARGALVISDRKCAHLREQVLATDPDSLPGRRCREDYLLYLVCTQGPAYALAGYAVEFKKFQFLKKSPAQLSSISHSLMRELAASLPAPQGELIAKEMGRVSSK